MPEAGQFHCLLVEFLAEQSGSSPRVLGLRLPSLLTSTPPPSAQRELGPPEGLKRLMRRVNGGVGKGQEKSS